MSGEVIPGDAVGPAVYLESARIATAGTVGPMAMSPGGDYRAERTLVRYSWIGWWAYSLTVTGYYHGTGTRIDRYEGAFVTAEANGLGFWHVHSTSAAWASQQPTQGIVRATGTFVHEIPTLIGSAKIQTIVDSVSATALP